MSVEQLVLSEVVREGSPRKMLQGGISADYFDVYDEEMKWVLERYERRKDINPRIFKRKFPDVELLPTSERLQDLLEELRQERAFVSIGSALDDVGATLDHENAIEKAMELKEILNEVVRQNAPISD